MSYNVNDKQVNSTQKCCKISSTKKLVYTNSYEDKKISRGSNIRWIISNVSQFFVQKNFSVQSSNTLLNSLLLFVKLVTDKSEAKHSGCVVYGEYGIGQLELCDWGYESRYFTMLLSVTLLARIRSSAMQGILLNVLYRIHSSQTNSESEQKERRSNPWYIKHISILFSNVCTLYKN